MGQQLCRCTSVFNAKYKSLFINQNGENDLATAISLRLHPSPATNRIGITLAFFGRIDDLHSVPNLEPSLVRFFQIQLCIGVQLALTYTRVRTVFDEEDIGELANVRMDFGLMAR